MNTKRTRTLEGRIALALLLVLPIWGVLGPGGARAIVRDLLGRGPAEPQVIEFRDLAD